MVGGRFRCPVDDDDRAVVGPLAGPFVERLIDDIGSDVRCFAAAVQFRCLHLGFGRKTLGVVACLTVRVVVLLMDDGVIDDKSGPLFPQTRDTVLQQRAPQDGADRKGILLLERVEKRLDVGRTLLLEFLHGTDDGRACAPADYVGKGREDILLTDVEGFLRNLSGEESEEGGSERIDIQLGCEMVDGGILLDGCVAVGGSLRGVGGRGFSRRGEVLSDTEIDKHRILGPVARRCHQHDIIRLDVEMEEVLHVDENDGLGDRSYDGNGLGFGHRSVALDMLGELTSVEVLHDIIGGIVLLEHLVHPHDMA